MHGKLVLIIGPSGSGKSSLIAHLRETHPEFVYPVSCTTREPRPGERDGDVYFFISDEEFDERIKEGAFLEWASYGGNRYGTLKSQITEALEAGKVVIREIEVQGARSILETLPREQVAIIFVDAGSWEELEERIQRRATVAEPELKLRRERYEDERTFLEQADYVIENGPQDLAAAKARIKEIADELARSASD